MSIINLTGLTNSTLLLVSAGYFHTGLSHGTHQPGRSTESQTATA